MVYSELTEEERWESEERWEYEVCRIIELSGRAVRAHNLLLWDPDRRKIGEADEEVQRSDGGEVVSILRIRFCFLIYLPTAKQTV